VIAKEAWKVLEGSSFSGFRLAVRLFCGVTQIDLALNRMVEAGPLARQNRS
jgi:hypothetical protein